MITAIVFALGVLSALSTCLALFTPRRPLVLGWLAWVVGLVPCEVPRAALVMNAVLLGVSVVFVPLDSALGVAAIVLFADCNGRRPRARATALARPSRRSGARCVRGLGEDFEHDVDPDLVPSRADRCRRCARAFAPFPARRRDVEHVADVAVRRRRRPQPARSLRPPVSPAALPRCSIYLHGGAWTRGKKDHQGLPIVYHFASRGWLCVQPNYRLCPDATFPDQIVDIKRVIAWVHEHAARARRRPAADLPHRGIGRRAPDRARRTDDERPDVPARLRRRRHVGRRRDAAVRRLRLARQPRRARRARPRPVEVLRRQDREVLGRTPTARRWEQGSPLLSRAGRRAAVLRRARCARHDAAGRGRPSLRRPRCGRCRDLRSPTPSCPARSTRSTGSSRCGAAR